MTTAIPTLTTLRLVLRPFEPDDLAPLAAIHADPQVMRYVGDGRPCTREQTWRSLATHLGHWQLRGYGKWAVVEQATAQLIGRAGLWQPEGWPGLEVGWLLARDRWGHGLATEAGHAALGYAFASLGAGHVISVIHPDNAASIRVAAKLGETFEHAREVNGHPAVIYGITSNHRRST